MLERFFFFFFVSAEERENVANMNPPEVLNITQSSGSISSLPVSRVLLTESLRLSNDALFPIIKL